MRLDLQSFSQFYDLCYPISVRIAYPFCYQNQLLRCYFSLFRETDERCVESVDTNTTRYARLALSLVYHRKRRATNEFFDAVVATANANLLSLFKYYHSVPETVQGQKHTSFFMLQTDFWFCQAAAATAEEAYQKVDEYDGNAISVPLMLTMDEVRSGNQKNTLLLATMKTFRDEQLLRFTDAVRKTFATSEFEFSRIPPYRSHHLSFFKMF